MAQRQSDDHLSARVHGAWGGLGTFGVGIVTQVVADASQEEVIKRQCTTLEKTYRG